MATADDYAAWIVKNADKKGTREFDVVSQAYQQAKAQAAKKPISDNLNAETLDPMKDVGTIQRVREGIGSGINSVIQALTFAPKSEVDATAETNKPLLRTAGGMTGNIIGNAAVAAPTAFLPGANTITGAGLIGAITGALTTPGDVQDRVTGGTYSGLGGAAGQAIPRVFSAVKAAAEPLTESGRNAIIGRVMNRAAGNDAPVIASRLRGALPLVPGSLPTAAEVAESGGIAALQRAMSAADPEAYANRGMQQASARINAIRGIAQDDTARAAAVNMRSAISDPLYAAAKTQTVKGDAALTDLLSRPSLKKAMARAQELAADEGKTITFGANSPAQTVASNVLGPNGSPIATTVPQQFKEYTGEGLHYLKLALDDLMNSPQQFGIGKNELAAIAGNKRQLLSWIENKIPEYGQARTAFSANSRPINQMDVGKALLDKVQGPLADYGALADETGATFARALRNEGETVARQATNFRQGLADVLDPNQMQAVRSVAADLGRKSNAEKLGRGPGSNTFQNFAMDNLSKEMGMPSAVKSLSGYIPGMSPTMTLATRAAGAVGNRVYQNADELMRKEMALALLDPKMAAQLMEAAGKPGAIARILSSLPSWTNQELLTRAIQATPGVAGSVALPAYFGKE